MIHHLLPEYVKQLLDEGEPAPHSLIQNAPFPCRLWLYRPPLGNSNANPEFIKATIEPHQGMVIVNNKSEIAFHSLHTGFNALSGGSRILSKNYSNLFSREWILVNAQGRWIDEQSIIIIEPITDIKSDHFIFQ